MTTPGKTTPETFIEWWAIYQPRDVDLDGLDIDDAREFCETVWNAAQTAYRQALQVSDSQA